MAYIYFRLIDFKVNVGIHIPYMDPTGLFTVAFFFPQNMRTPVPSQIRKVRHSCH